MALLDQIGSCFKPVSCPTETKNSIKKALSYVTSMNHDEIDALHGLRCAFAHDFSLVNININTNWPKLTHHFEVADGPDGEIVKMPEEPWCRDYRHSKPENVTRVDFEKLGDLVEDICRQIFEIAMSATAAILFRNPMFLSLRPKARKPKKQGGQASMPNLF
jgi:hypothetical protein